MWEVGGGRLAKQPRSTNTEDRDLGLGPERAKQARGRARGAGKDVKVDEWCRSRGSVDKFRAMIKSQKGCLFRLLCCRDSSVRLGTCLLYIRVVPRGVVLRPSTPFRIRRKEYCACVRNIRRCGGRSSTHTSW